VQRRQVRDIEYQLLPGLDRRTTDIVIERNGAITARLPLRMTPEQVDDTVFSKRMWIYRNLAEWRDLNAMRMIREWVSGESFLYLGNRYRCVIFATETIQTPFGMRSIKCCPTTLNVRSGCGYGVRSWICSSQVRHYTVYDE